MSTVKEPPVKHFPSTWRINAVEKALSCGLHLIRDNFAMWAIRRSDMAQVFLCQSKSYFNLWRDVIAKLEAPDFDCELLPYRIGEGKDHIVMYNPRTDKKFHLDRKDLRSHSKKE